jgi:type IV pilus assembly protein PilX
MFINDESKKKFVNKQQGAVLIVGLIIMLLLTIIGLAAVRSSGMQELMAGNMRDRNLAFQAAEAGLREAEAEAAKCKVFDGTKACYEDLNSTTPVQTWSEQNWKDKSAVATVTLDLSKSPRFIIEKIKEEAAVAGSSGGCVELDPSCAESGSAKSRFFRVTSLGYGGTENSQVILQTTIKIKI